MMGHVTELTKRVRAVEKVCAIVSAVGIAGGGIVGTTVLNPPKAEACSLRLDGQPTYCPPWDDVVTCQAIGCVKPDPKGITDQAFEDNLDPNVFDHNKVEVTLFDTRADYETAHMGHSFPTGEWIEKIRDHESKKKRTPVEDMLNNTLAEYENGSNDPTEQEELLQLPSNGD